MKKQELIHLHGLLACIDQYIADGEDGYETGSERYDALDVGPSSIHKSKSRHKAGTYARAIGIVEELQSLDGHDLTREYGPGRMRRRDQYGRGRGNDAEELVQEIDRELRKRDADNGGLAAD
ncbi:MAG: UPF0058 family protein [Candidatus Nanohaloarchaea archaeon]|nr:UPF0058 family protein [Candidatus Nanohaloarchaea archaeon]